MVRGLNRLVAQEVVRAAVGGAVDAQGRRAAVLVIEEGARLAAARGGNVAMAGVAVAAFPVNITAMVGEMAGLALAKTLGYENPENKAAFGFEKNT